MMTEASRGRLDSFITFTMRHKLIVVLLTVVMIAAGIVVAPFDWQVPGLPSDPVPVDAIPDIGENQQIVFTKWMGRSPQDIEDQITYPLTTSFLGVPGVKTVRSYSMFGFSTIYLIFEEGVDFYWSRARVLEQIASLPAGTLPQDVQPALGPDATALGQVFWYTLEGRDSEGQPTGGWDLQELRSIQDWQVRYALTAARGVSEVASIGGFVQEYQVDVDADAMFAYGVTLEDVFAAVRMSNIDVAAQTIEINKVEYMIRGVGFIENISDIEKAVVKVVDNVPITVRSVATVTRGPAPRRGVLDKDGVEAVGGVVVARFGANPLATIKAVKEKMAQIAPGLPSKTLPDGTVSRVTIVPYYDRTELIEETLGTLSDALLEEILVTIIVVLAMVMHLRSSLVISGLLPLAVLMTFIAMKLFRVDANIVALSGIAIAIGTMVDIGIVISENILKHLRDEAGERVGAASTFDAIRRASSEVGGAVMTAVATTAVSFLPVFAMTGAEGKLFRPLALTKTFAIVAAAIIAIALIPPIADALFKPRHGGRTSRIVTRVGLLLLGVITLVKLHFMAGVIVIALALYRIVESRVPVPITNFVQHRGTWLVIAVIAIYLTSHWLPLGPDRGLMINFVFVALLVGGVLGGFLVIQRTYPLLLAWALDNKLKFMLIPTLLVVVGAVAWLGFDRFFSWLPAPVKRSAPVSAVAHALPGLGREFMPALDEGSYLFMPTTMPHASIGEAYEVLSTQDMMIQRLPEIESAVGKIGRIDSALDPAPISMIETVVAYRPEYLLNDEGHRRRFRFDKRQNDYVRGEDGSPVNAPDGAPYIVRGTYERDDNGALIEDRRGMPFRVWRPALDPALNPGRVAWPGIRNADGIWDEIVRVSQMPGTTSAPRLQPIAARLVMLQSGMRAPMGIKVQGPDLETIESFALELERLVKEVPAIRPATVVADRTIGKPYLEIIIDRDAIARYGIHLGNVQNVIEVAVGGRPTTYTVEGRERYPVRVRYLRELRDNIDALERILVATPDGTQVPLGQLARIEFTRGPQAIKSEDTFLITYVVFDKQPETAEVDAVEAVRQYIGDRVAAGELTVPAGVSYSFAGSYENQVRAQQRLTLILPLSLILIFLIMYLQFRSVSTTVLVFSGIAVAWAGGFVMLWLYGQDWFLDFSVFNMPMRELFQVHVLNLSVAVWVGFLALFGIAADNGVLVATYLQQTFRRERPANVSDIRKAALEAGMRRIRPCLMTTATTVLALIPVLTSTGRGSDVMVPMAIPSFGGMVAVVLTTVMVPVLFAAVAERELRRKPTMIAREA